MDVLFESCSMTLSHCCRPSFIQIKLSVQNDNPFAFSHSFESCTVFRSTWIAWARLSAKSKRSTTCTRHSGWTCIPSSCWDPLHVWRSMTSISWRWKSCRWGCLSYSEIPLCHCKNIARSCSPLSLSKPKISNVCSFSCACRSPRNTCLQQMNHTMECTFMLHKSIQLLSWIFLWTLKSV